MRQVIKSIYWVLASFACALFHLPRAAKVSQRSVFVFRDVLRLVCRDRELVDAELVRAWQRLNPKDLHNEIWTKQLREGNRCRDYCFGPHGWSGDSTGSYPHYLDFVGVRSRWVVRHRRQFALFVIRHELQHEIQKCRDQITERQAEMNPKLAYEVEHEANQAAISFLRRRGAVQYMDRFASDWILKVSSRFCSTSAAGRALLYSCILLLIFLLYVWRPWAPPLLGWSLLAFKTIQEVFRECY